MFTQQRKLVLIPLFLIDMLYCISINNYAFLKQNQSSFGHTYKTLSTRSATECCITCGQEYLCNSVNFIPVDKTCELNNRSPFDFPYNSVIGTSVKDLYYLSTDPCPESWILYDRHCYLVVSQKRTWRDSEDNCQTMGANLTDIIDVFDNTFVDEVATKAGVLQNRFAVWIGMGNYHTKTPRMWTTGKPMKYVSFSENEPNNGGGNEDCIELGYQGLWNDKVCDITWPSVCKKPHY